MYNFNSSIKCLWFKRHLWNKYCSYLSLSKKVNTTLIWKKLAQQGWHYSAGVPPHEEGDQRCDSLDTTSVSRKHVSRSILSRLVCYPESIIPTIIADVPLRRTIRDTSDRWSWSDVSRSGKHRSGNPTVRDCIDREIDSRDKDVEPDITNEIVLILVIPLSLVVLAKKGVIIFIKTGLVF